MRRNLYIPDPDWTTLRRLAALESADRGRTVSPSEYLRELVEHARRLRQQRDARRAPRGKR